jgi:tetratricopeptide (TPR) repeat protein
MTATLTLALVATLALPHGTSAASAMKAHYADAARSGASEHGFASPEAAAVAVDERQRRLVPTTALRVARQWHLRLSVPIENPLGEGDSKIILPPLLWERGAGGEWGQTQPAPDSPDALLAAARKVFDSLDYERALVELDKVVALLEPRRNEAGTREQLATALELRARTHFGLGATGRAREDFLTLIALLPDYELDDTVSPRVAALFKDVRSLLVGQIALSIEPGDAQVVVDGRPVDTPAEPIDVVSGEHTLTVTRSGYKPATVNVSVEPGRATEWRVTLERASATLSLETKPGDVEVLVNGTSRGRTADAGTFVLNELTPGAYTIELRKPCHQSLLQRVTVEQLIDYRAGPFTLAPAIGGLQIGSSRAAQIFLDGKAIGDAPRTVDPVCEGTHIVEARTRAGRDIQRIEVKNGEKASITLTPRPVIALLATAGAADAAAATKTGLIAASSDLRAAAERALAKTANVLIHAPAAADVRKFETEERAPSGWLAFDLARKPLTPGARQVTAEARRDLSARLSKAMNVQGVAALVTPPNANANAATGSGTATGGTATGAGAGTGTFWLVLLSAGASEPDVIELELNNPAAATRALDASSVSTMLLRRTLGLTFVDVAYRQGPVIVDVVGGASGIVPGDALTRINGEAVANEQDVRRLLEGLGPATTATLTLQSRAGTPRDVVVPIAREPRLVTLAADSGLANISLLDLRTRLSETTGLESTAIRLNIAAALMRAGQPAAALEELQAIKLPDGPGFSNASVQYLIGLCQDALGRAAEARQAWEAASRAPRAILSEDGPLVSELAARRLQP